MKYGCEVYVDEEHTQLCNRAPTKYYLHISTGTYVGVCKIYAGTYPKDPNAFRLVSYDEAMINDLMEE